MIQTLMKNWWLLALCGTFDAIISFIYFMMYDAGPDATPLGGWNTAIVLLCRLSIAAGVCAVAAGMWRSTTGVSWLLSLNGLALGAYGLIPLLYKGSLRFRLFALLIVVMAANFGVLAVEVARTLRRGNRADKWFFGLAGAVSVGFALGFFALANGWIQLERRAFHPSFFLWLGVFFGVSAICLLVMAVRVRGLGPSRPDLALSPLGNPSHAH
jgi:hypothetical protein